MKLSAVLVLFVLLMIVLERWQRGRMRFSESHSGGHKTLRRIRLKGWGSFWAILVCFVPLLLGFLLPVVQLLSWSFQAQGAVVSFPVLSQLAFNTFILALLSAVVIVLLALLAAYVSRIGRQGINRWVVQGASLGYAVPGAVIAVGSMAALLALDRSLSTLLSFKSGFWISGTLLALVYAYAVRFFAVAVSPVEAGFQKISPYIDDAAAMAGRSRSYALWRVHVPALKGNLVAGLILVVVDVMKELPLTLILRPFNFETLSTVAFELADDERVAASALVSMLIVAVGIIPVVMLNRLRDRY
jgi:iron(III) transport system permease protein